MEKNTFKEASGEVGGAKVILYSPWNWRLLSDFPDTLTPIFDTNLARNSSHIYRSLLLIEVNHEGIFEMYPWSQAKTLANLKIGIWLDYQVLSSQIENKVSGAKFAWEGATLYIWTIKFCFMIKPYSFYKHDTFC